MRTVLDLKGRGGCNSESKLRRATAVCRKAGLDRPDQQEQNAAVRRTTFARLNHALLNSVLRVAFTGAERIRRTFRLVTRPELFGAHAIPLTPEGKLVLIKLRYVPGWRLPGGGLKAGETPREAAVRELREEIGLLAYSSVEMIREGAEQNAHRTGHETLFLVTGILYRPRWCLEVEAVEEFGVEALPPDLSPWTVQAIDVLLFSPEADNWKQHTSF